MKATSGIRAAGEGLDGQVWDILGQTYVPKHVSEASFSWHATFPPGTFVPRHTHPTQDEFIHVLEGRLDFVLNGEDIHAGPGDIVALPMGVAHSIHNRSGADVLAIFWVTPTRMLYEYFQKISGLTDPQEVTRLAAEYEVPFD